MAGVVSANGVCDQCNFALFSFTVFLEGPTLHNSSISLCDPLHFDDDSIRSEGACLREDRKRMHP